MYLGIKVKLLNFGHGKESGNGLAEIAGSHRHSHTALEGRLSQMQTAAVYAVFTDHPIVSKCLSEIKDHNSVT